MPVSRYFKGHGSEVMADMQRRYGAKKGKSVFYATANKHKMTSRGIPDSTPELGPRVKNKGDGPAMEMAHMYEERAKPRPGQPPFGPMTPGGKGMSARMESHLKGSDATDAHGWMKGLPPGHMKCCKGGMK